jgi:hypothetical protein
LAARSNVWLCGCELSGITGSNIGGDMAVCLSVLNVCYDGSIARPQESYSVCDCECECECVRVFVCVCVSVRVCVCVLLWLGATIILSTLWVCRQRKD